MKILVQWTTRTPADWEEFDSLSWGTLPRKSTPVGGEVIDDTKGWCHGLNVQGRVFQADHYHVSPITDGARVTAWNDDSPGERYARVVDFLTYISDSRLGGAINTRQKQIVFAEPAARARMERTEGTIFQLWSEFIPPTREVMHGIKVSDQLHLDHRSVRSPRGWREWTEGVDASELDERGEIKKQRPLGRFPPATGTRTYFMQAAARANGVHTATDEVAFETGADSSSVTEGTGSSSDELSFLFTTPTSEPDQGTWTTGTFRCSFDAATVDADMEFGLLTLGGSAGHFGRVDSGLSSEVDTQVQTQGAITATGITVVDTGSVTWTGSTQSDRFECLVAQRNTATMGGPQTVTLTCDADAFADGPWPAAAARRVMII